MKTLLLTLFCGLLLNSVSAQRNVNLSINLMSPVGGSEIAPMTAFTLTIEVKNIGAEPLIATDSLAVYLIMNGDTIQQMSGNYWLHTNIELAEQETHTINKQFAFDNSLLGAHVDFCIFVKPFNRSNPVVDNVLSNNKSCAGIDVLEPVNSIGEITSAPIVVYPNPVKNKLFIDGENVTNVLITDPSGKVVLNKPSDLTKIDCNSLVDGIYFVKVETSQGYQIRRMIVEK